MTSELDRELKARRDGHSQELGEFLDWLRDDQGFTLCKPYKQPWCGVHHWSIWDGDSDDGCPNGVDGCDGRDMQTVMMPAYEPTTRLLARYFGIDERRAEIERRELLAQLRAARP